MSAESRSHSDRRVRPLRDEEIELLRALLATSPLSETVQRDLSGWRVEEMADGGMGSLTFVQSDEDRRTYGRSVAEALYVDADGVDVTIAVDVDDKGILYELDFWKVDFSPLKRYPRPSDLREVRCM
jgi:hypothetical protein